MALASFGGMSESLGLSPVNGYHFGHPSIDAVGDIENPLLYRPALVGFSLFLLLFTSQGVCQRLCSGPAPEAHMLG